MKKLIFCAAMILLIGCRNENYEFSNTTWDSEDCILTMNKNGKYFFTSTDTIITGTYSYSWQNLYLYASDTTLYRRDSYGDGTSMRKISINGKYYLKNVYPEYLYIAKW